MLGIASALMLLAWSAAAHADIRICNHAGEKIWVAMAAYQSGRWISSGWYGHENGTCRTLVKGRPTNTRYYFHVQGESGKRWGGPNRFCVEPNDAFTIERAEEISWCEPRPFFCRWTADGPREEIVVTPGYAGLHESRCDI
ncbi:uncharacterized protein CMC5_057800 [Chondromyces crocatus]|uniref:DUF1036 domain-containing protein n=2 Tax=Chondromyces crocatus TaxID=52 RepID=A0A0K1ELU7_CHOCO|nr:uncharacterized protein CMC5_057800 [Chondromyces crocatus]